MYNKHPKLSIIIIIIAPKSLTKVKQNKKLPQQQSLQYVQHALIWPKITQWLKR